MANKQSKKEYTAEEKLQILENRIKGYIERIEKEKITNEKIDVVYVLKEILKY